MNDTYRISIDSKSASESNRVAIQGILYSLIIFCILLVHPFYIFVLVTMASLSIRFRPFFMGLIFSTAFAAFWASRNYAVDSDDLKHWLLVFSGAVYESLGSLIPSSLVALSSNEPVFYMFTILLGRMTKSEYIYVFINYLLLSLLLFYASWLTSKRHYLLVAFCFLFGIGSLAEGPILHLWRQTYASLFVYISIVGFWHRRKAHFSYLLLAVLTHLSAATVIVLRLFSSMYRPKSLLGRNISMIFAAILFTAFLVALQELVIFFVGADLLKSYYGESYEMGHGFIVVSAVLFMFLVVRRFDIVEKEILLATLMLGVSFVTVILPEAGDFQTRLGSFSVLTMNYFFFHILVKMPKSMTIIFIPILFYNKMMNTLMTSVTIVAMFPYFSDFWQGILFQVITLN